MSFIFDDVHLEVKFYEDKLNVKFIGRKDRDLEDVFIPFNPGFKVKSVKQVEKYETGSIELEKTPISISAMYVRDFSRTIEIKLEGNVKPLFFEFWGSKNKNAHYLKQETLWYPFILLNRKTLSLYEVGMMLTNRHKEVEVNIHDKNKECKTVVSAEPKDDNTWYGFDLEPISLIRDKFSRTKMYNTMNYHCKIYVKENFKRLEINDIAEIFDEALYSLNKLLRLKPKHKTLYLIVLKGGGGFKSNNMIVLDSTTQPSKVKLFEHLTHELLHEWWPKVIADNKLLWMSEAIPEYIASLFSYIKEYRDEIHLKPFINMANKGLQASDYKPLATIPVHLTETEYNIVRGIGVLLLHKIASSIDVNNFLKLISKLSKETGLNLNKLINAFKTYKVPEKLIKWFIEVIEGKTKPKIDKLTTNTGKL